MFTYREGMKAKKRVTKLVLAVITVFTGKTWSYLACLLTPTPRAPYGLLWTRVKYVDGETINRVAFVQIVTECELVAEWSYQNQK